MGVYADDEDIKREVDRFYDIARESLRAVWLAVEALAKALLKHGELDHNGIDSALAEVELFMPVFAVQEAHGLLVATPAPGHSGAKSVDIHLTAKKHEKPHPPLPRSANDDPRVAALLAAIKADLRLAPIGKAFEDGKGLRAAPGGLTPERRTQGERENFSRYSRRGPSW